MTNPIEARLESVYKAFRNIEFNRKDVNNIKIVMDFLNDIPKLLTENKALREVVEAGNKALMFTDSVTLREKFYSLLNIVESDEE